MADTKITALLTPQVTTNPATDVLPIVNIADTLMASSGSTRKITVNSLLGAGGTATLASATITGDLTVRTNKLKVDATGVAIGATSAAYLLDVRGTDTTFGFFSGLTKAVRFVGSASTSKIEGVDNTNASYQPLSIGCSALDFSLSGSTAMTLNSTGLGVGVAPSVAGENIYVRKDQAAYTSIIVRNDNTLASGTGCGFTLIDGGVNAGWFRRQRDGSGNTDIGYKDSLRFRGAITGTERTDMTIDSTGNVGIGVTPSAWNSSYKAIEILGGNINTSSTSTIRIYQNAVVTASGLVYKTGGLAATGYVQSNGSHFFQSAVVGTNANDPLSLTTPMTLDASGNLILLSSATPATLTTNGQLTVNATSNTNLRFSYRGSDGTTRVANITLA